MKANDVGKKRDKMGIPRKKEEEKGIALIITLGILAILIVVALAFVASARTSRKAAATHASVTGARLIAESALEKITGLIRYYNTHNGEIKIAELASSYASGENVGSNPSKQDWLYRIFSGTSDSDKAAKLTDASGNTTVEWEYVKINGKIVGRVGYTVEADGKVNPARIVDNTTTYPNAMGGGSTPRDEANSTSQLRLGIDVNEMCLADLPGITAGPGSVGDISDFNSNAASPAGKLHNDSNWPDIDYLSSQLGVTNTIIKRKFKENWFNVNPFETKEAFWSDDDNDGVVDANGTAAEGGTDNDDEIYCRFNLRRYVDANGNGVRDPGEKNLWDDLAQNDATTYPNLWASTTENDANDVAYLLQDPKRIDDPTAGPNNTGGIMWLSRWGTAGLNKASLHHIPSNDLFSFHEMNANNENKNPGDGIDVMRGFMAARIIDYCDSDSVPTSDVDPAKWDHNNKPSWYGWEKNRYVNDFCLDISVISTQEDVDTNNDGTYDSKRNIYQIQVTAECETADMFRGDLPNVYVYVSALIRPDFIWADGSKQRKYIWIHDKVLLNTAGYSSPSPDFYVSKGEILPIKDYGKSSPTEPNSSATAPSIEKIYMCTTSLILRTAPYPAGYGLEYLSSFWADSNPIPLPPGISKTVYIRKEIEDPRQPAYWGQANLSTGSPPTILGNNSITIPSSPHGTNNGTKYYSYDKDKIDVLVDSSPSANKYVQSAYIRNDMMKSPWELGFIPRCYPFQTLRLDHFNDSKGNYKSVDYNNKHMVNGGNYYYKWTGLDFYGDANILSQVKMQPEMSRYGLVNINTNQQDVLKLLLSRIRIGQTDLDNFATDGTELASSDVNQLANAILNDNGSYSYRSQAANALEPLTSGSLASNFDTAAKREELLGKFINLTGTTSNTYRIIILAQSIKDVGGATLSKDLNYDGKIDATGATDTYDADGDAISSDTIDETASNTKLGQYDQMFDEITAEQKIAVDLAYDATTNKWLILKYEYMDD